MVERRPSPSAGEKLREVRERLGLTVRDVEAKSQQIAEDRHNREYYISHAWVTDIENDKFTPTIFKLHSLSNIYSVAYPEVLLYYGIRIGDVSRSRLSIGVPRTHLLAGGADLENEKVSLPTRFKPGVSAGKDEFALAGCGEVGPDSRWFFAAPRSAQIRLWLHRSGRLYAVPTDSSGLARADRRKPEKAEYREVEDRVRPSGLFRRAPKRIRVQLVPGRPRAVDRYSSPAIPSRRSPL